MKKKRPKATLVVHDVEEVFEEVTVNSSVPIRLNQGYAKLARETLQLVATMMTNTPQYIRAVCLRKGIPVRDASAAFDLLKRFNGNIDKIENEFLLAGAKTLDNLRSLLNPLKEKNSYNYRKALYEITTLMFKKIDSWRNDKASRNAVSDDMQRMMIMVSRYVNPIPDSSHRKFIAQCRCASCNKETITHAHRIREIDDEAYPLLVPLCDECYDAPNGINYYVVAEHYYALSQYLSRMIDDITGRTWAGFDGYKKVKAQSKAANTNTNAPS